MFDWLRKGASAPSRPAREKRSGRVTASAAAAAPALPTAFQDTTPLPAVVGEGNSQADWSAWEDSMSSLDSQLQSILPTDRVYVRDTRPSQLDEPDPFSSVRSRRDA